MRSSIAHTGGPALHSELARFCLPPARRDENLCLAWVNSLGVGFLIVGVLGLRAPSPVVRPLDPVPEAPVMVLELPATTRVPREEAVAPAIAEAPAELPAAAAPSVATLERPSVVFSVPAVGDVLAREALAAVPVLDAVVSPALTPRRQPLNLAQSLGTSHFPAPRWTTRLMQARMSGTILLHILVDDAGRITEVVVKQSTGHRALDEHTVNHVKRYFIFPSGRGSLTYELPVEWDNPLLRR